VYTRARRSAGGDRLDADNGLERLRPFFSSVEVEREPDEERGPSGRVRGPSGRVRGPSGRVRGPSGRINGALFIARR